MSAHRGRCFRALRRKRRQEKQRRLGLLKAARAPLAIPARRGAIDSLWQQFVGIGTVMKSAQQAAKQLKQQGRQYRTQARG